MKVCESQVNKLKGALGKTQDGIQFNNRVPQPLNHRAVALMEPGAPRAKATNVPTLPASGGKWVYANAGATQADAAAQAATWGGLCVSGHEQSPINVITSSTVKASLPTIATSFSTKCTYVKNTGRGFQLFETSPVEHKYDKATGKVVEFDNGQSAKGFSLIGGDKFNFYQVNWHTPSENTIDGKSFAMEAHLVHQLDDVALHGTYHRLAVIGLLYDLGTDKECNTFLSYFWNVFPNTEGSAPYSGERLAFQAAISMELAQGRQVLVGKFHKSQKGRWVGGSRPDSHTPKLYIFG